MESDTKFYKNIPPRLVTFGIPNSLVVVMDRQRLRETGIGFLLCLAFVVSCQCGASNSIGSAEASSLASDLGIVGGVIDEWEAISFVVLDKATGNIKFSNLITSSPVASN